MAVSPFHFYNDGRLAFFDGTVLWKTEASITAVLLDDSYSPDDMHSVYSDLTGELLTGEDHDYEPKLIPNRNVVRVGTDVRFTSAVIEWGMEVTIAARYLVVLVGHPDALNAGDPLIGYVDFGEMKQSINSEYSFTPDNNIWFTVEELNLT